MEIGNENRTEKDVLLNVNEAAELLRLSPGTIYQMVSARRLPGVAHLSKRCLRFWRGELLDWARSCTDKGNCLR